MFLLCLKRKKIMAKSTTSLFSLSSPLPLPLPLRRRLLLPIRFSFNSSSFLDDQTLSLAASSKDADQALSLIASRLGGHPRLLPVNDCCALLDAALRSSNPDLALSVYQAMSSGGGLVWDAPDVRAHGILVKGLAMSLRVSEANTIINYVSRAGISQRKEVSFGKIIRCPTCLIAMAVAQPQHGLQAASCSNCRYQYELVSGDIISISSEEISMDNSTWAKGLRFFQILKKSIPAAIHSIVINTPTGTARTHRFATKTVELPAQEGERVTIALATTSDVSRGIGPFKFSARSPEFTPGEPLRLTNHVNGQESELLRAPRGNGIPFSPSIIVPALAILASGDAAAGLVDPSLPRLISVAAVASVTLGTAANIFILPRLNQLPQRIADTVAFRQQLLSQYDMLQVRITDLIQAAEKEVWMLARMSQLEKKIIAVGEPSYRARRSRIKRVCENLESSLMARIELLESYARISSMIEIEVEMDSNVLAAEAESNAERISEQIEQIMEMENLEEKWRIQAEANDEVERLLNSQNV